MINFTCESAAASADKPCAVWQLSFAILLIRKEEIILSENEKNRSETEPILSDKNEQTASGDDVVLRVTVFDEDGQENKTSEVEDIVLKKETDSAEDTEAQTASSNARDVFEFRSVDVSEPRDPISESEAFEEAQANHRREWFRAHRTVIFAGIGVVIVALIVFGIYLYFQSTNPMSRFNAALAKDFSSSFHYDIKVTEDDKPVMSYDGAISIDRGKHDITALYQADYNSYTYTGAVYAHGKDNVKGSYYNDKWAIRDCAEGVQNFFDFDKDFRAGKFNTGAFLRFTKLTSDYSTTELNKTIDVLKQRLSTNSTIATINTQNADGGKRYDYTINLYELFLKIKEDGAPVFYRATDYDSFAALFDANKSVLENAECTASFEIDSAGYLTNFNITVKAEGRSYGLSCAMSDFSSAEVTIPESFFKAAQITPEQ